MNFNAYSPTIIVGACVVVGLIVLALVLAAARQRSRRRTAELRSRFGPEYDAAVERYGSRSKAESVLLQRLRRIDGMAIRPLTGTERSRYVKDWEAIQARFVDHPRGAVTEADEMINSVLQTCGYTAREVEQRAADLSVHHPRLVDPYRRASAITARAGRNEATTEELRTAMILYRALFESLLQTRETSVAHAEAA